MTGPNHPTDAIIDRRNPDVARELLRQFYPDPEIARFCKRLCAYEISKADTAEAGSWMVTMRPDRVALNVGRLFFFGLYPGAVTLTIDSIGLSGSKMNVLKAWGQIRPWESMRC